MCDCDIYKFGQTNLGLIFHSPRTHPSHPPGRPPHGARVVPRVVCGACRVPPALRWLRPRAAATLLAAAAGAARGSDGRQRWSGLADGAISNRCQSNWQSL
jgi:hypothetical protein